MIGRHRVGHDVPKHQADVAGSDGAPGIHVVRLLDRQDGRAEHASDRGPPQHADGDDDGQHAGPLLGRYHGQQQDREKDVRERQEDIRSSHDRPIGQTTVVAGKSAQEQPDQDRDEHRGNADREGHASAKYHAREYVPTQVVSAHRMLERWRLQAFGGRSLRVDFVRRPVEWDNPEVGGHGRDDDDQEPDEGSKCQLVASNPVPGVAPQGSRSSGLVTWDVRRLALGCCLS